MTTVTWGSDVTGDWYAPANWSQNHVPVAGDTAVITAGTAELLSLIDPASAMTLELGGPTTIDTAGGAAANVWVDTLNNTIGPDFTITETTAGDEGILATAGITDFSGAITVSGTNTLLGIGVDLPTPVVVKHGVIGSPGAVVDVVANPADIGQFQNNGTISVSDGAGLVITPVNTLDNGQVSMLIGTINLDAGVLASTYVTLGPPTGGFDTSGTINMANGSTAAIRLATNIDANFADGAGNRLIFTSTSQTVVISGFQYGDEIEQAPQSIFGTTTPYGNEGLTYNAATHVLQIDTGVGGTPFLDYTFAGTYKQTQFQAGDDDNGNLVITLACFAAGTRIATDRGEVPVEALTAGDRVATARGAGAPCREVRWIGYRHVDLRNHPDPAAVRPIRISAGAFDGVLPRRDLLLSPDHAVFQGGVLIPVRYLVNDATIAPDPDLDAVTYYHVELATHDVLLAEGLAVESYLDTGNRHHFSNGGKMAALHADFSGRARSWDRDACAELRGDGPVVTAVRRQLLAQAQARGFAIVQGREVWLEIDGTRVDPGEVAGGVFGFVLPMVAGEIHIRSHTGVPAHVDAFSTDRRRLGVMVQRVVLRRGRRRRILRPEDPRLAAGFHRPEQEGSRRWRWTDGNALLPVELIPPGAAAPVLELHVAGVHARLGEVAPSIAAARVV